MPTETYGILLVSFSKHSHQQHSHPPVPSPSPPAHHRRRRLSRHRPRLAPLQPAMGWPTRRTLLRGPRRVHRRPSRRYRQRSAARLNGGPRSSSAPPEAGKHLWIDKFPGATLAESEASAGRGRAHRRPGDHSRLRLRHPRPAHPPSPRQRRLRHPARRPRRCDVRQGLAAPDNPTSRFCRPQWSVEIPRYQKGTADSGGLCRRSDPRMPRPHPPRRRSRRSLLLSRTRCPRLRRFWHLDPDRCRRPRGHLVRRAHRHSIPSPRRTVAGVPNRHPPERHHRRQKARARRLSARLQHRLRLPAHSPRPHAVARRPTRPNRRPIRGHSGPSSRTRRLGSPPSTTTARPATASAKRGI